LSFFLFTSIADKSTDLRVAVPTTSNPFTFPDPSSAAGGSFVDNTGSSTSSLSSFIVNPSADAALSTQFDLDKFVDFLTSSDAHFDVNELYKIVSDPGIVSKVAELDAAGGTSASSSNGARQQPLYVTSGPAHGSKNAGNMATGSSSGAKVLPDLSELIDDSGDTHESYYKGLEQNEFQSLDTPLVDGLD
jgi:hypothetical protein